MLDAIVAALRERNDLMAWTVRQVAIHSTQLYAVPKRNEAKGDIQVENRRQVSSQHYVVNVLKATTKSDGTQTVGSGNVTLLPTDDIQSALDAAALMAGLVHNQPYTIPGPTDIPNVPVTDTTLQSNPDHVLDNLLTQLEAAVAKQPQVRMTAAECYATEETVQLCNSRGVNATQTSTQVDVEWVLLAKSDQREVESFVELTRRRITDLDLDAEVARQADHARDLLRATPSPTYSGHVVMRNTALATFLRSGVLETLSSGAAKYSQLTPWEIGQSVFRSEVNGDSLNAWANRCLPYGTDASRFDGEGLPAQRVELIRDNKLMTFIAGQRYADYLSIAPTGAFGDLELAPGTTPTATLLAEPYVEIVAFSWFNPDIVTGDFASEIRLGYIVDGEQRRPFKGGVLVGNVLDALANVRWSQETGFFGNYQGPTTARFYALQVAGDDIS